MTVIVGEEAPKKRRFGMMGSMSAARTLQRYGPATMCLRHQIRGGSTAHGGGGGEIGGCDIDEEGRVGVDGQMKLKLCWGRRRGRHGRGA